MQKYIFSADKNAFFPVELKIAYQESGICLLAGIIKIMLIQGDSLLLFAGNFL
ncbi:Uncharacterised protein [Escherichia coli]|nr:Uncharacterised protein [Escherichia coli]